MFYNFIIQYILECFHLFDGVFDNAIMIVVCMNDVRSCLLQKQTLQKW